MGNSLQVFITKKNISMCCPFHTSFSSEAQMVFCFHLMASTFNPMLTFWKHTSGYLGNETKYIWFWFWNKKLTLGNLHCCYLGWASVVCWALNHFQLNVPMSCESPIRACRIMIIDPKRKCTSWTFPGKQFSCNKAPIIL